MLVVVLPVLVLLVVLVVVLVVVLPVLVIVMSVWAILSGRMNLPYLQKLRRPGIAVVR